MGPVPKKQDKGETPAAGKLRTKKEYGLMEDGETNGTGAEPLPERPNPCFWCVHSVPDGRGHGCPWTIDGRFLDVPGWKVLRYMQEGGEAVWILYCPRFRRG